MTSRSTAVSEASSSGLKNGTIAPKDSPSFAYSGESVERKTFVTSEDLRALFI
jgi:hypothetical protein